MNLTNTKQLLSNHFHALEKEIAPHSCILAWRIPEAEEPGGLPSMGLQSQIWLKRLSSSSSIVEPKYWYNIMTEHASQSYYNLSSQVL